MNWFKDKTFRILFCIGITLILCGIPFMFFLSVWPKLGPFMGMVGGGVIGLAIGLKIAFRPQTARPPNENNLKRKAWKDLWIRLYSLVVGGISFYYLIVHSDKMAILESLPARFIMLSGAIIVGIWVAVGQFVMKKRILFGLDERQRLIYEKAKMISDAAFGGLWFAGLFGLWAWLGLKTSVPIYVPILLLFGLAFIAEIIQPLVILIQCKMEQSGE